MTILAQSGRRVKRPANMSLLLRSMRRGSVCMYAARPFASMMSRKCRLLEHDLAVNSLAPRGRSQMAKNPVLAEQVRLVDHCYAVRVEELLGGTYLDFQGSCSWDHAVVRVYPDRSEASAILFSGTGHPAEAFEIMAALHLEGQRVCGCRHCQSASEQSASEQSTSEKAVQP